MTLSRSGELALTTHATAVSAGEKLLTDSIKRVQVQCDIIVLLPTLEHKLILASSLHRETRIVESLNERLCDLGANDRLSSEKLRKPSWILWRGDNEEALRRYCRDTADFAKRSSVAAQSLDPVLDAPTIAIYSELSAIARRQREALRRVATQGPTVGANEEAAKPTSASALTAEHVNELVPGRDRRFQLVPRNIRPTSFQSREEETGEVLHSGLMGLEVAAIEVCCANIRQFPAMPWEFVVDMAHQISDEARHAYAHLRRMAELETDVGRYPVDLVMWNIASALPLPLRLATIERIGEWIGFEYGRAAADRHRAAGDDRTASMRDFINAEEVTHVGIGNKWLKRICQTDEALAKVHTQAIRVRQMCGLATTGPASSVDQSQAARAGFSEDERARIDAQRGARKGAAEAVS